MNTIDIHQALQLSATDPKDLSSMVIKVMEEVGELAEAVNYSLGNLPHKDLKEPPIHEVADVIITTLAVAQRLYPHLSVQQLISLVGVAITRKLEKYAVTLEKAHEKVN